VTGVTRTVATSDTQTCSDNTHGGIIVTESNRHASRRRWTRLSAAAVAIALVTVAFTALGGASVRHRAHQAKSGGDIIFGLEAETNAYCLTKAQFAISGIQVVAAVYDTLTVPNSKGVATPYLAKSIEPNADFTVWTIGLRDGVKFHDGTPVDAAAVKLNLDSYRGAPGAPNAGSLLPIIFNFIQDVAVTDPTTVTVTLKTPVSAFPDYLFLEGRVGIMAPAQINAGDDCATKMIGSGPFTLESYAQNEKTVVVKNPDYWQKGYPKADKITFVPVIDGAVRATQLQGGQLNVMHTSSAQLIESLSTGGQAKTLVQQPGYREITYNMMITNDAPFDNPVAREAFTTAIDRQTVNEIRNKGLFDLTNSLMDTKAPGYLKDAGYPKYNLKKAKKLVEQVKAESGGSFDVVMATTPDAENSAELQLVKEMLDKAGINASIIQVDQATLINRALAGDVDVFRWRQLHGGYSQSADQDNYPWFANYNTPTGGKNLLNFGHFDDTTTQDLLTQGRSQSTLADEKTTYTDFNKAMAAGNYISPLWYVDWAIAYLPEVSLNLPPLPDGQGKPLFVYGRIPVHGLSASN
jgi:peptide/nickel transport system substrate-binding protein